MHKILRFEITDKCNLSCNMCWSTDWKHSDMNWNKIQKIIKEYSDLEPNGIVVLTSREPLLSSNFLNTLKLCTKLNLDIKILTNGTLLNDKNCEQIMRSNVSFVGVSLHGKKKDHDEIVNVKNSFDRTIHGIKKLNEWKEKFPNKKIDVRITTTVSDKLINSIDEIIEIASSLKTNLRIQHIMYHSQSAKEKHKEHMEKLLGINDNIIDGFPDNTQISAKKVKEIIHYSKKACKEKEVDLQIYPDFKDEELINWYDDFKYNITENYCDHVFNSIRVRANGEVTLCQYIDKTFGNLTENTLKETVYNNREYKRLAEELLCGKMFPICSKCCHCRNRKTECKEINNYKI